jgi:membrane protein
MAGLRGSFLRRLAAAAGRRRPSRRRDSPTRPEDLKRAHEPGRGRQADGPLEVPSLGWKDILLRTRREVAEDQLSLVAAGVAFYFMLALFPALLAIVAVYGVVADPATVAQQAGQLIRLMPAAASQIVVEQLVEITTGTGAQAGIGAALAILFALWSAAHGTRALLAGLNIAYDERERRGIVKRNLLALGLTLGFITVVALGLALITALPHVMERLPLGGLGTALGYVLTWGLVALLGLAAYAILYRFGPSRQQPRWQWVSVGSAVATGLWLLASLGFSWYSARFDSFNKTYGTLTGGILLLLWLQITAYVTLLGAELNAEIEHQTARDSTTGPPEPLGERGAQVADTVGEAMVGGKPGDDEGGADEPAEERRAKGTAAGPKRRARRPRSGDRSAPRAQ